jgi:hypothetical protein
MGLPNVSKTRTAGPYLRQSTHFCKLVEGLKTKNMERTLGSVVSHLTQECKVCNSDSLKVR